MILFTTSGGSWLDVMVRSGCDVRGIDWTTNIGHARLQLGQTMGLQGNMDPTILYQSAEVIEAEVSRILADYGKGSGHIFNLGHGIPQDVNLENVAMLVDAVHKLSQPYHTDQLNVGSEI